MAAAVSGQQGGVRRLGATLYLSAAAFAAVILVQSTLLSRLRFLGVSPNLPLVVIVCWSILRGVRESMLWGFLTGLGVDLIAGQALGMTSLGLILPCLMSAVGARRVFSAGVVLPALLVVAATPLHGWLILLVRSVQGLPVQWVATTLNVTLPELGLNVLLTLLVYPLVRAVASRLSARATEW